MIGGVNFQPGSLSESPERGRSSPQSVQEAIKVLSLRLPKVVGARAMAPGQLLTSPGSGGNPMIDSVVNQVLSRYFPTSAPSPGAAPAFGGPSAPSPGAAPVLAPRPGDVRSTPAPTRMPRITPVETGQPPSLSPPGVYAPPPAPNAPPGPPVRFDNNPPPREVFQTPTSPDPPVDRPDAPMDLIDIFRRKFGRDV